MELHLTWYDDSHTILCSQFEDRMIYFDITERFRACCELMNAAEYPVSVIFSSTKSVVYPKLNAFEMGRIARHPFFTHPRLQKLYVCNMGSAVHTMVTVFSRVYPSAFKHMEVAQSMDDALRKVQSSGRLSSPMK